MNLISYKEARTCIENVEDLDIQMFLKATYLLAALGCEIAGKIDDDASAFRRAHKIVYGPKGTDVSLTEICIEKTQRVLNFIGKSPKQRERQDSSTDESVEGFSKIPIALFNLTTARQNIKTMDNLTKRVVALPLCEKYEPWTRGLYNFFKEKKDEYVFPFKRQQVWQYLTKKNRVFKGTYRIRNYTYERPEELSLYVLAHPRKLKMFGLRYLRSDELIDKYKFNWGDWEVYSGATAQKRNLMPWEDWHRYINKLCV